MLFLSSGAELRVGDRDSAGMLDSAWQVGSEAYERVAGGSHVIRRYDDGSTRFTLVLQPTEGRDPRIVAIYVAMK
jgi:hypothetical protein